MTLYTTPTLSVSSGLSAGDFRFPQQDEAPLFVKERRLHGDGLPAKARGQGEGGHLRFHRRQPAFPRCEKRGMLRASSLSMPLRMGLSSGLNVWNATALKRAGAAFSISASSTETLGSHSTAAPYAQ